VTPDGVDQTHEPAEEIVCVVYPPEELDETLQVAPAVALVDAVATPSQ
jgi:hypothetical protein